MTEILSSESGFGDLILVDDNIFTTQNEKILKFDGNNFLFFKDFDPIYFVTLIGGRKQDDLFTKL